MLSHTDLARFLAKEQACPVAENEVIAEWQLDDVESLPGEEVTRYLTRSRHHRLRPDCASASWPS